MYDDDDWDDPIAIEIGCVGRVFLIRNAEEASDCIIDDWPIEDGAALNEALAVCIDVAQGIASSQQAREAFLKAVDEAAPLVQLIGIGSQRTKL